VDRVAAKVVRAAAKVIVIETVAKAASVVAAVVKAAVVKAAVVKAVAARAEAKAAAKVAKAVVAYRDSSQLIKR
jgi:hypothetical protein